MLVDKIRIDFCAGDGGRGSVDFHKNGKPDGGDGGPGGDVYVVGDPNLYDLRKFNKLEKFEAEKGQDGSRNRKTGARGKDLIIKLPLVTKIYDLENKLVITVDSEKPKLLLKGGAPGRGNHYFRKGQIQTLHKSTPGKRGEELKAFAILELSSDIVFIGLPNAGKSSMLNALTNTNVKVADYPFTTLYPYLGTMNDMKLMDLPGLIEGTSEGKGLGRNYEKHLKNAKAVAHFLSLDEENFEKSYNLIKGELKSISPELSSKPEILVLTKSDNYNKEEINSKLEIAKKLNKNYVVVSVINDDEINELKEKFTEIIK